MPDAVTREARITAGRCVYGCGASAGSGLACPQCASRHAAREAERRADLRKSGTCVQCGQAKADPGYRYCAACRAYQARAKAAAKAPHRGP